MTAPVRLFALLGILAGAGTAQVIPDEETLRFNVNWPSGLSLGEATIQARKVSPGGDVPQRWEFDFRLDAAVPEYKVVEHHRATASKDFCSLEFEKTFERGKRKAHEKAAFDAERGTVTRSTVGGGASEVQIAPCAKDALTFFQFLRHELGQRRLPPSQTILFGAGYRIRLQYGGASSLVVGQERLETDRLVVTLKGPASETSFEVFIARDHARTPVLVKAPLAMGTFSMELVR